jgi:stage V sporulation protein R
MLEFMHHHSNVIYQPDFDSKYYSGINPYTLGFAIFSDLKRMSISPTEEDFKWFPSIAGKVSWQETFRSIVENYKDETFVLQFLSPTVIRDLHLFEIHDEINKDHVLISHIHDEFGYKAIRKSLSEWYNRARYVPDIQVLDVCVYGDRCLTLDYTSLDEKEILISQAKNVIDYVRFLWGFPVKLIGDGDVSKVLVEVK